MLHNKTRYFSVAAIKNSDGTYITKEHEVKTSYMYIGSVAIDTTTKRVGNEQLYKVCMDDAQWEVYKRTRTIKEVKAWKI